MKKYKMYASFGKNKYLIEAEYGNKVPFETVEKVMKERITLDVVKDIKERIKFFFLEEIK